MDAKSSLRPLLIPQNQNRELHVIDPMCSTSTTVPICSSTSPSINFLDGWIVERRPRQCNGRFDKYYYEPGTGRKFRSLLSVQKYLTEEKSFASKIMKPGNGKNIQIVPGMFKSSSPFTLPEGWVVKEKRRSNINKAGVIDRHYIEPGTGKRFRSLASVKRHLTEQKQYEATPKSSNQEDQLHLTDGRECKAMLKAFKLGDQSPSKCSDSAKKNDSGDEVVSSILDLCSPPAKVKWVLSPGGSIWSPFIDDTLVEDSLKQKWSETFQWILNPRC
ncbi:methyl-CpG-binding domain-containing protein 7 isoform X2 [Manihot esculenta]|uniref:MBD domain-containing protein n=1 Tax=Manihot esculenta TaxID=3983 RepID=A0A2C9VZ63_MANES|nr:methyl-CpG-binding domain-containing protein 7 isoform X2 [Manihot esculenta]OAY51766.1 hypothetical protein MANES_04G031000v8 [Manihot esculenta]